MAFEPFAGNMGGAQHSQGSAGVTDAVTQLQGIVRQLSALVQAFQGRMVFGTLQMSAAATTTVLNAAVRGNSIVQIFPTNAAAAALLASAKCPYYTVTAGTSFTLHTADGNPAAGTETFSYIVITPF